MRRIEKEQREYEVYSYGECMTGPTYTFYAVSDVAAKRIARGYHHPYQSNWSWYGSTALVCAATGKKWILHAGHEGRGWVLDIDD